MNGAPFYESDRALGEYLLFHYGKAEELLPWPEGPVAALNYPVRCVSECVEAALVPGNARGLDLGCAVGRSTFELARSCTEVVGIDFSHRFIEVANQLQRDGVVEYRYVEEGQITKPATAEVPGDIDRARVRFEQGDAQGLRPGLGIFDVVLMANLVDRLADPERCLSALPDLVKPGGQLILSTPCTWLEEYTPLERWLGGFGQGGRPVRTLDGLRDRLEPRFELLQVRDLPFLIREHARKYQWSVAQASCWRRTRSDGQGG